MAGIAAGVLAGLAATLVLVTGDDDPRKLPPRGTGAPVVTDPNAGPVRTDPPGPAVSRVAAARRLATIKAMHGAPFDRYEEMRKALVSFAAEFRGVPEADEAAALLKKIDGEYAEMAEIALAVAVDDAKYLAGQGRYGEAETSLRDVAKRYGADPWLTERGPPGIEAAIAEFKKKAEAMVSGTLANAKERLEAGDVRGARAALSFTSSWGGEEDRARAKEVLDEIGGKTGDDDGYVSGLTGEYFLEHDRDPDKLKLKRVDPDVFFDWGGGQPAPEVRRDNFSARWTGEIMAPADGKYEFQIDYDDGVILAIDGNTVGETWQEAVGTLPCEVELRAGWRRSQLDFKEHGGGAYVKMEWQGPGFARCRVPGAVLRTRAP
ncbi:MAG: PA14 domain-containing protein [Planctomycetota bacterium]|jgi:hypothetical protein